jgi:hypothetical protein
VKIELREVTIRELAKGYSDEAELGVRAFDGKLDVRPPYQREFVYKDKQRDAVIDTVMRSFPLNVMYWSVRDDGTYEIIDGQQRTISICQYVEGDFAFKARYFHNLQKDEQARVLDYKLMIYVCSGTDSERLDWFRTINIAGEELTHQELRNAVYAGSWVTDAKKYFSRTGCPAYAIGSDYLSGTPIRQDYLEDALKWISDGDIEGYMAQHQHDPKAIQLWDYFQSVIAWVRTTFPTTRSREMRQVAWGPLYNKFRDADLNPVDLENRIVVYMEDSEIRRKAGIYTYVLTGEEKWLNLRQFEAAERRSAFERQKGVCPVCKETFPIEGMEADHIKPWHKGGKTTPENCQMLCIKDNRLKSGY